MGNQFILRKKLHRPLITPNTRTYFIWLSLYFWFEAIIYRTRRLATNHDIARLVGQMYSGGALSQDTLPIQNQPCLCPDLPLYPSTLIPRSHSMLESNASIQFSGLLQHMAELVFPV